jgi:hypothetical protein
LVNASNIIPLYTESKDVHPDLARHRPKRSKKAASANSKSLCPPISGLQAFHVEVLETVAPTFSPEYFSSARSSPDDPTQPRANVPSYVPPQGQQELATTIYGVLPLTSRFPYLATDEQNVFVSKVLIGLGSCFLMFLVLY